MKLVAALIFLELLCLWNLNAAMNLVTVPDGAFQPFWLAPVSRKSDLKKDKTDKMVKPAKPAKPKQIPVKSFITMDRQVTIGEFKKFLITHPEWNKSQISPIFADDAYLKNFNNTSEDDELPITSISWFAARAYCQSIEMRLPTTNEWEYMAQASENQKNASKDEKFLLRILNWYGEPGDTPLKTTRSIYKNLYGIWDLHGLVWEWVSDFNSSFVTGESREDSALNKDLFCGAGNIYGGDKENYAAFMRFAFRSSLKGISSIKNLGFRCVRSK